MTGKPPPDIKFFNMGEFKITVNAKCTRCGTAWSANQVGRFSGRGSKAKR